MLYTPRAHKSTSFFATEPRMDFTRNLSSVQHLTRAWSPVDSRPDEKRRSRTGLRVDGGHAEDEVLCPRPRRPATVNCPASELSKPSRRQRSKASGRGDGVVCFELLDIFLSKGGYRDVTSCGCSPPSFCGSPPTRAGNPLIHDAQFLHPRSASNLSQQLQLASASYSSTPTVRIEGFASDLSPVSALA